MKPIPTDMASEAMSAETPSSNFTPLPDIEAAYEELKSEGKGTLHALRTLEENTGLRQKL
jgi:hypothetical protein